MSDETTICPGCQGEGVMVARVQRLTPHGRRCTVQQIPCVLCQGRQAVTAEEIQAFERFWTGTTTTRQPLDAGEGEG